jgi:hypothetical protein
VAATAPFSAQGNAASDAVVVEVRSYNLKPGTRDRFHERLVKEALPMLQRWRVDVVAYGPSLHDRDSYYLMRAFPSIEERQRQEEAFYGSEEWRTGLRDAVLADIESYTTVVVRLDNRDVARLRRSLAPTGDEQARTTGSSASGLAALLALNDIRFAQTPTSGDATKPWNRSSRVRQRRRRCERSWYLMCRTSMEPADRLARRSTAPRMAPGRALADARPARLDPVPSRPRVGRRAGPLACPQHATLAVPDPPQAALPFSAVRIRP